MMHSNVPQASSSLQFKSLPHSSNLKEETKQFQRLELVGKVIIIASCCSIGRSLRLFGVCSDVSHLNDFTEESLHKLAKSIKDIPRLCVFSSVKYRSQGIRPYSRKVFSELITGQSNLRSIDSTSIESLITDSFFLTVSQLLVIIIRCIQEYGNLIPSTDLKHENLKRLFWRILENLGEGLLLLYLGHGLGTSTWETAHMADGSMFPCNYSRLDRTATDYLMANNINDTKQWKLLGFELLKVIGFIELYRCTNRLKGIELPRSYRIFGRGYTLTSKAVKERIDNREVKSNENVRGRASTGSGSEYSRGRSSSVVCRRSNSVTKESDIQGFILKHCSSVML